jgi:hypothetical protein
MLGRLLSRKKMSQNYRTSQPIRKISLRAPKQVLQAGNSNRYMCEQCKCTLTFPVTTASRSSCSLLKEDDRRVDLVADYSNGLFFCPWNFHPGNSKKASDKVVALDSIEGTCFLPPSFFAVTMVLEWDQFILRVARRVDYLIQIALSGR